MWLCTTGADAAKVAQYYPTRRGVLRGIRVVWRAGGAWERLFIGWVFGGFALYTALMLLLAFWQHVPFEDWQRKSPLALLVPVTFLPAIWAWESVSTLQALSRAGLENTELTQMKIEYLERFGLRGANPTARRWAGAYVALYLLWTGLVFWVPEPFGLDPFAFALVEALLVVSLGVLVSWRLRAFSRMAELRGYPFAKLAVQLRNDRVRW